VKLFGAISKAGLFGAWLFAAAASALDPHARTDDAAPQKRFGLILRTIVFTVLAGAVLLAGSALAFVESGVYDLAAAKPHTKPVEWTLQTVKDRAVRLHSQGIQAPALASDRMVAEGFVFFRKDCEACHGAPGIANQQLGRGINPKPPPLELAASRWSDAELYWIISEGLKMSGMPSFAPPLSDGERWAIVAFLRRLSRLSPAEYRNLSQAADQGAAPGNFGANDAAGFARLHAASAARGRGLVTRYGCTSCHTIPGTGRGLVGPPLTAFAERQYIGGILVNLPSNAIAWIANPKQYKPGTAMPNLGVPERDAADIAAYLYTLGGRRRIQELARNN